MKRLVICFDGTWKAADADQADTNIALLARAIDASVDTGGSFQSVLYARRVGRGGGRTDDKMTVTLMSGFGDGKKRRPLERTHNG